MLTDTERKIIFYGGAAAIAALKIYGVVKGKVPWYLVIALAAAGIITEPERVAASTLDDARAQGLIP